MLKGSFELHFSTGHSNMYNRYGTRQNSIISKQECYTPYIQFQYPCCITKCCCSNTSFSRGTFQLLKSALVVETFLLQPVDQLINVLSRHFSRPLVEEERPHHKADATSPRLTPFDRSSLRSFSGESVRTNKSKWNTAVYS